jgi:lactate dehydrogenase-like 2-hydroxyacid dehydrogenase
LSKIEILLPEPVLPSAQRSLDETFFCHRLWEAEDKDALVARISKSVRGIARGRHITIGRELIERLPNLEIIAGFGVGYDGINLQCCVERGIVVTNTPDVLTEETADAVLGLLLMTVRELSAAERYLRAGKWVSEGNYRRTPATLRDRTVGMVGLGRIGRAVARRVEALNVPVVYHSRHPRADVTYRHYADLLTMASDVDTLIVVLPANESTRNIVDSSVLTALGPQGILINGGRGLTVDEQALIEALTNQTILAAGLDVYVNEPYVPEALLALDNVVLLPHVGSASIHTHDVMGQLLVTNLRRWFEAREPVTPVPETPWFHPGRNRQVRVGVDEN